VLNARVSWQAPRHMSFFFEGENILDHRYASFGLYSDSTGNGYFEQPHETLLHFFAPLLDGRFPQSRILYSRAELYRTSGTPTCLCAAFYRAT